MTTVPAVATLRLFLTPNIGIWSSPSHSASTSVSTPMSCNRSDGTSRNADGSKAMRMTNVMDFYKLEIGDTRGYSPYAGGGVLQQVLEPAVHRHRSLAYGE